MRKDKPIAAVFLPGGEPVRPGDRVVQAEYADTLAFIVEHGEAALYEGPLGDVLIDDMKAHGGFITRADLTSYRTVERAPVRADYRGWAILGPPPPAASGVHIAEMLNILEGFDVKALGFGTAETVHLLAEVMKIAFADRAAASGDPDYVAVPVERLTAKDYAHERRNAIDPARAQQWQAAVSQLEGAHTTHITVADRFGNVVATTQTINNLFGAKILAPGLGTIANNYMHLFDPRPGHALSLAPGKRVTTSMSPMMALRDGKLVYALGLPGGKRIFPSAIQALINLIDHGMSLQEAVEAPRLWTEGNALEVEPPLPEAARERLRAMGHDVVEMATVARRHERGPVPRGRHHVRRRLLARRRHAGCDIRWTGAGRRAVRIAIAARDDLAPRRRKMRSHSSGHDLVGLLTSLRSRTGAWLVNSLRPAAVILRNCSSFAQLGSQHVRTEPEHPGTADRRLRQSLHSAGQCRDRHHGQGAGGQ